MTQPEHDYDDPLGYLNAIEAASLKVDLPLCRWCRVRYEVVPMVGNGWGVEHIHEAHCPEHEDNRPAAEYHEQDDDQ